MPSFKAAVLAIAMTFVASTQADYYVDPSTVNKGTRERWCQDQKRTCPMICQQVDPKPALVNDCDADTLFYGCICGNGLQPNMSEYTLTLPYYTCTEWGTQCVKNCGLGNNQCSSSCRQDNPCGAQDPSPPNETSTKASGPSSTSVSPNQIATGLLGATNTPGAAPGKVAEIGRMYGLAVVLGSIFAGFAML